MNYKVLYRKYRPDSFENLVGQKPIVEILKNSIKEKKIAHAYIFSGPRGTGKTSTARILAKSINCINNISGLACNECDNCRGFNTSPDIIEIDAASNNGVDEIRELINNVKIMPTSLKYKIYIIDEVHMLSQSAFNALLLTLEEPPEHVIFILATTNLESVPITILSRCQKFDFKRISMNDITDRLVYICEQENIKYNKDALREIALLADGGLRDALSILDQLSKNSEEITLDLITNEVGTISNKKIGMLITAVDENKIEQIEQIIAEFREVNLNYKVVIKKIIDIISKFAVDNLKNGIKNHLTYDDYKNMVIEFNDILNKINVSVDPYVLIEFILLNYVDNQKDINIKIEKEEPKIDQAPEIKEKFIDSEPVFQNKVVKSTDIMMDNLMSIRINNCFFNASKECLNNIKQKWNNFLNDNLSAKIKGLIADTMPVAASDKYSIVVSTIKHKTEELNNELLIIEDEFCTLYKIEYKFIFIDESKWIEEKQKYINNLQNGIKYEFLEEKEIDNNHNINENNDIEELATTIFGKDKIEIK